MTTHSMLALKLLLVPAFLLLLTLASQRLGPAVAGWLAGLPVVAGPVLFVLALENGAPFAAAAASASAAAVLASVSFALTFARTCQRLGLRFGLPLALLAWLAAAWLLTRTPLSPAMGLCIGALTVSVAPRLFPASTVTVARVQVSRIDLLLRMIAGAALTLFVTLGAERLGPGWAGVLAVAPILSLVLAVSSFRQEGAAFTTTLLRSMAVGLYSFTVFCTSLAIALPRLPMSAAFGVALLLCLTTQRATQRWLLRRPPG